MPFEHDPQSVHPKSGLEPFVLAQLCFQLFRCNLCCLRCTRQRTGYNEIRLHLETVEKLRDLPHFFFAKIGERPLIIRLCPVRPVGLAMSEKIKLHGLHGHSERSRKISVAQPIGEFTRCLDSLDMTDPIPHTMFHFGLSVRWSVCQRRTPPRKAFRLCP